MPRRELRDKCAIMPKRSSPTPPSSLLPEAAFASPHRRVDVEGIFRTLRFRIVTLHYRPGTVLREKDLGEEFGASRTPLRNAIQRLEQAGLVRPVVGKGTIVTPIDIVQARDALNFRIHLAGMLSHFIFFDHADAALEALQALEQRQLKYGSGLSRLQFASLSHESRSAIEVLIFNDFVLRAWSDTYYIASRLWFREYASLKSTIVDLQLNEMRGLQKAIRARDANELADVIQSYLTAWRDALMPVFEES